MSRQKKSDIYISVNVLYDQSKQKEKRDISESVSFTVMSQYTYVGVWLTRLSKHLLTEVFIVFAHMCLSYTTKCSSTSPHLPEIWHRTHCSDTVLHLFWIKPNRSFTTFYELRKTSRIRDPNVVRVNKCNTVIKYKFKLTAPVYLYSRQMYTITMTKEEKENYPVALCL